VKSPERLLISAVLQATREEQDEFTRIELPDSHWKDYKQEIKWILDFKKRFNKMPSLATMKKQFPDFMPIRTKEPVRFYLKTLCDREDYNHLRNFSAQFNKALMSTDLTSIDKAKKLLLEQQERTKLIYETNTVEYNQKKRENSVTRYEQLAEDTRRLKQQGTVSNRVPPPYASLVKRGVFPGHEAGDLVVLIARPKMGKTWYTLVWALNAALWGFPTLVVSKEMSIQQMEDRIDAILFDLDYAALTFGTLPEREYKRWKKEKAAFKFPAPLILCDDEQEDDDAKPRGIGMVEDLIVEHKTFFNAVDSAHLFFGLQRGVSMAQDAYQMSRKSKRIARRTKSVMMLSTQAGREAGAVKGDYIAAQWADAFEQDASVTAEVEGDRNSPYRTIKFRRTRFGCGGELKTNFQMSPVNLQEHTMLNTITEAQKVMIEEE
jgi:hypothetical protein